jgi:hypothetical protein
MKQDLSRAGHPRPVRRTAARSFSLATKQRRFQEVEGRCEACGELIGAAPTGGEPSITIDGS